LFRHVEILLTDHIRSASSFAAIKNVYLEPSDMLVASLATAMFTISLLGRAQVYAEVRKAQEAALRDGRLAAAVVSLDFEPLPFDEAIAFFRDKTTLTPTEFALLESAAQYKAFTVAAGATSEILSAIRALVDEAQTEGLTLAEFQSHAADILESAGAAARTPWYWETVYRTNLQTSYQVGRWKQMVDPDVVEALPYWRYVSARIVTSRPSHVEKHGLIYPAHHPFWKSFYPPNGFNCLCSVSAVSPSQLERRGWKVSEDMQFKYPEPDPGWATNPGEMEVI
jgi:hypothetical protein